MGRREEGVLFFKFKLWKFDSLVAQSATILDNCEANLNLILPIIISEISL